MWERILVPVLVTVITELAKKQIWFVSEDGEGCEIESKEFGMQRWSTL